MSSRIVAAVERATSTQLTGPDWSYNLELADSVNNDGSLAHPLMEALKQRMATTDSHVQFLALSLVECLMKNCSQSVYREVGSPEFLQQMEKLALQERIRNPKPSDTLDKVLRLCQAWDMAFSLHQQLYPNFRILHNNLNGHGFAFPPMAAEDILSAELVPPSTAAPGPQQPPVIAVQVSSSSSLPPPPPPPSAAPFQDMTAYPPFATTHSSSSSENSLHSVYPPRTTLDHLHRRQSPLGTPTAEEADMYRTIPAALRDAGSSIRSSHQVRRAASSGVSAIDKKAKLLQDLEIVRSNTTLFSDLLEAAEPHESIAKNELASELHGTVKAMQQRLVVLTEEVQDDAILEKVLSLNDDAIRVLSRYDALVQVQQQPLLDFGAEPVSSNRAQKASTSSQNPVDFLMEITGGSSSDAAIAQPQPKAAAAENDEFSSIARRPQTGAGNAAAVPASEDDFDQFLAQRLAQTRLTASNNNNNNNSALSQGNGNAKRGAAQQQHLEDAHDALFQL